MLSPTHPPRLGRGLRAAVRRQGARKARAAKKPRKAHRKYCKAVRTSARTGIIVQARPPLRSSALDARGPHNGPHRGAPYRRWSFIALSISRRASFSLRYSRLSYALRPRASPTTIFARPRSFRNSRSPTIVRPRSCPARRNFYSSRAVSSSLRSRRGAWLLHVPHAYSAMFTPRIHNSFRSK